MSKGTLFKCSRCGKFRPEMHYQLTQSGNRQRACIFCSGFSENAREEQKGLYTRECGVCGKKLNGSGVSGGWLCAEHKAKGKRVFGQHDNICDTCPQLLRCRERVNHGLWVLCEMPDSGDVDRVRAMLEDQTIPANKVVVIARKNY